MISERLRSLDAFRGATIAAMILVNNPGSWEYVYPSLRHAEWHGWTPTDFIFPFFIFIMGVSVSLAFSRRRADGLIPGRVQLKVARRTLLLFALGLFLALYPGFEFAGVRIPGVLQRIALCYLVSALLYLAAGPRIRLLATTALLAGYGAILLLIPVPGGAAGDLSPHGNLCGFIDTRLLGGHLYRPDFDPEGLLSTLPAIATALLGTLAGDWLRTRTRPLFKAAGLSAAGAVLAAGGLLLHPIFPINKQLWTSSYVLLTAGWAMVFLGLLHWMIEGKGLWKLTLPFQVFGTNAILAYVGSGIMVRTLALVRLNVGGGEGGTLPLKAFIYRYGLAPLAGLRAGSLLYPVLLLMVCLVLLIPLYRRRIFLRI